MAEISLNMYFIQSVLIRRDRFNMRSTYCVVLLERAYSPSGVGRLSFIHRSLWKLSEALQIFS